jgi:hypothetical protein
MPVRSHIDEMLGTFPRLPSLHALQLMNRAWSRVRDMRLWSWQMVTDAQLIAPLMLTGGTVSTTAFSTTVTVNSAAAAIINAAAPYPPIAGTIGVGRQIKINISSNAVGGANGTLYTIVGWDNVNTLTLDRPFGEGTQTGAPYSIYKAYYEAPSLPFSPLAGYDAAMIRPISLTNKASGYAVNGRRLYMSQEELNRLDPQRGATGDPYGLVSYGRNALGQPIYELYPAPVNGTTYYLTYYTRWPDLSFTVDFPQVPYGLVNCVMDLARAFACGWALANVATYQELQQTNWVAATQMYRQDHADELKLCLKQDDEIMPQLPFLQGRRTFPFSGNFLQNHDVSSLLLN